MTEFTAKVLRNGTMTIPAEIRATEGLKKGDYARFNFITKVGQKK